MVNGRRAGSIAFIFAMCATESAAGRWWRLHAHIGPLASRIAAASMSGPARVRLAPRNRPTRHPLDHQLSQHSQADSPPVPPPICRQGHGPRPLPRPVGDLLKRPDAPRRLMLCKNRRDTDHHPMLGTGNNGRVAIPLHASARFPQNNRRESIGRGPSDRVGGLVLSGCRAGCDECVGFAPSLPQAASPWRELAGDAASPLAWRKPSRGTANSGKGRFGKVLVRGPAVGPAAAPRGPLRRNSPAGIPTPARLPAQT